MAAAAKVTAAVAVTMPPAPEATAKETPPNSIGGDTPTKLDSKRSRMAVGLTKTSCPIARCEDASGGSGNNGTGAMAS